MGKKRLVTRSDFDGLVCAMMLRKLDIIDEIKFDIIKMCRTVRSNCPRMTLPLIFLTIRE